MSSQGVSTQAVVMSYNTTTGAYVVGDSANITLKFIKDGSVTTPTNSVSEPSGAGIKGAYVLSLTSAETQCQTLWIGGNSSSANTIIVPITLTFTSFAQLPVNVTQINGVSTATSSAQIGVNVVTWEGDPPNRLVSGLVATSASGGSISTVSGSVASVTAGVNVTQINGATAASSSAQLGVNVITWRDATPAPLITALVQTQVSGTPSVVVTTNNDKTGYSLTQSFPANFSALAITGGGATTVGTNSDKTGYSLTSGEETNISNAVWDNASGIETNVTPRQALRYIAAAETGVTVGALTSTFTISAMSAAGTTRITATTDSSGNRSAVVLS